MSFPSSTTFFAMVSSEHSKFMKSHVSTKSWSSFMLFFLVTAKLVVHQCQVCNVECCLQQEEVDVNVSVKYIEQSLSAWTPPKSSNFHSTSISTLLQSIYSLVFFVAPHSLRCLCLDVQLLPL